MTTISEAREAIYQRWIDSWTATTDFTLGDEDFTPGPNTNWARLSVRHQAPGGHTLGPIGGRRFTRLGSVFVQLFVPASSGDGALDPLIKAATDLFEGVSFSGLRFFQAHGRETGVEGGKWNTALVEAPFDYDEPK